MTYTVDSSSTSGGTDDARSSDAPDARDQGQRQGPGRRDHQAQVAFLLAAVALLAGGCESTLPKSIPPPEVVRVNVPVPCLPAEVPDPPRATPSEKLLAMTPRVRYLTIAADREAAIEWVSRWGPAVEACRQKKGQD